MLVNFLTPNAMIMKVEERRGTRNESHTLSSKKEPLSIEDLMPNTGMGLERRKKYLLSGIQSRNDYEDRQREREREGGTYAFLEDTVPDPFLYQRGKLFRP